MLTLNDGRSELWQWDTGRKLIVDAECSQVHFSNKVFGRSIDVDVVDGVAVIPDILLQTDKDLNVWAFVGTPENGYTKISKVFKVNKRNKPADYVFTTPEQTTLEEIKEKLDYLESIQDPDAIKNAVDEYLANNPIQIDEKDPTVPDWAKQTTKPKYTATEVGAVAKVNGVKPDANGNVEITIPDSGGNVENGEDGFSPIATVEQTATGAVISITDKDGTTTATITNGKDGADGAPGEKGDKGDKGDPGEPGQKGEQGIQGEKGEKGDPGTPGADGAKGDKGDTGAQGEPGKDGANGKDGTSATHSWNGTVLTITSASGTSSADLKGAKGDKGDTGAQGIQGEPGADGAKGDKGDKGDTGADGKDGVDGKTPVRGTDYWTETDKAEIVEEVVDRKSTCYMSLPSSVHIKVGSEFRAYFRNILSLRSAQLWVGSNSNLTTRYYDEYMSIAPTTTGNHVLNWKLYDEASNLLESGTLTVIAAAKTASLVTKAMVIGDSTVNAGTMTQKTIELYTTDGAKLSLLGSRGTSPNLHEGRGGWTAADYCTKATDGTYDNPFYNNGFDFTYYMTNRGYLGVQTVVIQLGINDVFLMKDTTYTGETVLGYINQMVTSILAYDSNIKIVINLPITPNSNGTSFTEAYGTTQLYWLYNRNSIRFSEELVGYFANNANVTISASNCVLDTKTQIADGVHPTADGYQALGQRLYEVLISIVDGVVASLLSINDRPYVVNNSTTITATGKRDLDTSKCFAGQTTGVRAEASNQDTYEALGENSLAFTTTHETAGRGVEFPLDLEVGKTYTLRYTASIANARVYLMKYNADTTYNSNSLLSSSKGTFTKTITPESGYIYSVMFTPLGSGMANVRCVWSDISLYEND